MICDLAGSVMSDVVNRMVDRLVENSSEGLLLYSQRRIPDIKVGSHYYHRIHDVLYYIYEKYCKITHINHPN